MNDGRSASVSSALMTDASRPYLIWFARERLTFWALHALRSLHNIQNGVPMLGAIIGGIVGSVYEFRNHRSKVFEPFFHPNAFYTDDTICTVAVADALVNDRHPAQALKGWGRRYWDNGGWGQRFAMWMESDELAPYASFKSGAAMRVAPAGLLARSVDEAITLPRKVTEVTGGAGSCIAARSGGGAGACRSEEQGGVTCSAVLIDRR